MVAKFIFIIFSAIAVTYLILKASELLWWWNNYGPDTVTAIGVGAVLLLAIMILGGNKK